MQYQYPQQYIFIPSDWASGLASGMFIIGSIALFLMLRRIILNYFQKGDKLLALSNLFYAIAILIFMAESLIYIRWKTFLDEYIVLSLLSITIAAIVVLGIPKFRLLLFAFGAIVLAIVPIDIPPLTYTVQSRTYTVILKYIPLELYVAGVIIFLLVMFFVIRLYGPLALGASLVVYTMILYALPSYPYNSFSRMMLHMFSFSLLIASALFGGEKSSISGFAKTLTAIVVILGIGFVLYSLRFYVSLALTIGGLVVFSGTISYLAAVFDAKYYKFKDIPSLLMSLGYLLFTFSTGIIVLSEILDYKIPQPLVVSTSILYILIYGFITVAASLFAIASLLIIKRQKYVSIITFVAGAALATTFINPVTLKLLIMILNMILLVTPTLIFLRFGYKLYKLKAPGASVTLSIGLSFVLYTFPYTMLGVFTRLTLVQSVVFFLLSSLTAFILMYGIVIKPALRSVKER